MVRCRTRAGCRRDRKLLRVVTRSGNPSNAGAFSRVSAPTASRVLVLRPPHDRAGRPLGGGGGGGGGAGGEAALLREAVDTQAAA